MARKGRPSKYNNPETKEKLQELVYLYRKSSPNGVIRISHMVRFSKEMNKKQPSKYPTYDKDVWGTYGREFIDNANEPIRIKYENNDEVFEVPNVSDIVEKFHSNKGTLLSYLIPLEKMIHEFLSRENDKNKKISEFELKIDELKSTVKEKDDLIRRYEEFVLQMAHQSYINEFQDKFGLQNLISVNANKRNKDAMRGLDDLSDMFTKKEVSEEKTKIEDNVFLNKWKEKRQN